MNITLKKRRSQHLAFGIVSLLTYSIVAILIIILAFIIIRGIGVINWEFLSTAPTDGMTGGGIFPAIVGTCYLILGSAAFVSLDYEWYNMNEYAPKGKLVRFIRMMTNNLSGTPHADVRHALFVNKLCSAIPYWPVLNIGLLSLPLQSVPRRSLEIFPTVLGWCYALVPPNCKPYDAHIHGLTQ